MSEWHLTEPAECAVDTVHWSWEKFSGSEIECEIQIGLHIGIDIFPSNCFSGNGSVRPHLIASWKSNFT